jgi:molybdopterin-guanine dinucleotide biosynthesis protein A
MIPRRLAYPAVAVCGSDGSATTDLLEAVIPSLHERGLEIAVVTRGAQADRPTAEIDRLSRTGAEVIKLGEGIRTADLRGSLDRLSATHDLVLVSGIDSTELPKLWLTSEGGGGPPEDVGELLGILPKGPELESRALTAILDQLQLSCSGRAVMGGVLIGGQSRRMGLPKQLLEIAGVSLVERIVDLLIPHVEEVVLLGAGEVPPSLGGLTQIPDPPDLVGPGAGLTAGLRRFPRRAWLMVACDQPRVGPDAITWLLAQRRPGVWAVLPRLDEGGVEPLFAVYEPQALVLLEDLHRQGRIAPRFLAEHEKVRTPTPRSTLHDAWRGVDTPEGFRDLLEQ